MIMHEIIDGSLFQRGRTHGISMDEKLAALQERDITHAVALAPAFPDEDLVTLDGLGLLSFTHYPITDGMLRSGSYLDLMAQRLAAEIDKGGVVLTMCNAGRNRSGLLSALIVHHVFGIPGSHSIGVVRQRRPNALANDYFVEFLQTLK